MIAELSYDCVKSWEFIFDEKKEKDVGLFLFLTSFHTYHIYFRRKTYTSMGFLVYTYILASKILEIIKQLWKNM